AFACASSSFFLSSRRRHTRSKRDWSSDVCSSDLAFSQYVRPGTAAVNSLKSKAGWLGVAITTGENMYNNIQSGESTTTIVEDVAVDASLGVVSMLAAGAATAAAVGAGAPVLVGAAAGVGVRSEERRVGREAGGE